MYCCISVNSDAYRLSLFGSVRIFQKVDWVVDIIKFAFSCSQAFDWEHIGGKFTHLIALRSLIDETGSVYALEKVIRLLSHSSMVSPHEFSCTATQNVSQFVLLEAFSWALGKSMRFAQSSSVMSHWVRFILLLYGCLYKCITHRRDLSDIILCHSSNELILSNHTIGNYSTVSITTNCKESDRHSLARYIEIVESPVSLPSCKYLF